MLRRIIDHIACFFLDHKPRLSARYPRVCARCAKPLECEQPRDVRWKRKAVRPRTARR